MPHSVLEMIGTAPCVDAEWRGRLRTAYRALSRYLVAVPDMPLSDTYYCSHCGGSLRVQPAPDGTSIALPENEYAICPVVAGVQDDDRILKALNASAFYRSCIDGLGIDLDFQPLENQGDAWRLGSVCVRSVRYAVYAALFQTPSTYRTFLCSLPTAKPYVFVGGSYSHELEALLAERGSCFLTLQDDFELIDDSGFRPLLSATEKLAIFRGKLNKSPYAPDPEIKITPDYKRITFPDGYVVNLSRAYKKRAVVRYIHEMAIRNQDAEFELEYAREEFNRLYPKLDWRGDRLKDDLFKERHQDFDHLFELIDSSFGKYRIKL